jgi:hypothetical protein
MAQASLPLEQCYIHVRGDGSSLGGIVAKVKLLGGKVAPRLSKEVTHIIFQRKFQPSALERSAEDAELRGLYDRVAKVCLPSAMT